MKVGIDSYCYHRFFGEVYGPRKTRNFGALNGAIQIAFAGTNDTVNLRSYLLLGDPAVNLPEEFSIYNSGDEDVPIRVVALCM